MNAALKEIKNKLEEYREEISFSEQIFGDELKNATSPGFKIYIFGAGNLGQMFAKAFRHSKVEIAGFLDNDKSKHGQVIEDLVCYSPNHIKDNLELTHVVISLDFDFENAETQLRELGLSDKKIHFGKNERSNHGKRVRYYLTNCLCGCIAWSNVSKLIEIIERDKDIINEVYCKLADDKSRHILVSRIALSLAGEGYGPLIKYLEEFSDTVIENHDKYGLSWFSPMAEPEFKYYFNQDFQEFSGNEIYVDVGAEDGNTIVPFMEQMYEKKLKPKQIYAFEPDPEAFQILQKNLGGVKNLVIENSGIGIKNSKLNFKKSSKFGNHRYCGSIDPNGDISVDIHSIDSYFCDKSVSFLKFDPSGDSIIDGLIGASNAISSYKPKIIAGIYHKIENLYKIPKLIFDLNESYNIYIRHLAFHANETHAFAINK